MISEAFELSKTQGGMIFLLLLLLAGLAYLFINYLIRNTKDSGSVITAIGDQYQAMSRQQVILLEQQSALVNNYLSEKNAAEERIIQLRREYERKIETIEAANEEKMQALQAVVDDLVQKLTESQLNPENRA